MSGNELVWPHLVTKHLKDAYQNAPIDYVNAAVPGYTVRSSLRNFRERIVPLEPDIVVIYHATNDLSGETRKIAEKQGLFLGKETHKMSWLSRYSLLWFLVEKNLRLLKIQDDAKNNFDAIDINPKVLGKAFREELAELIQEVYPVSTLWT